MVRKIFKGFQWLLIIAVFLIGGCASVSGKMSGGTVPMPMINPNTGTWLILGDRVVAKAELSCFQILFMKFNSGDVGKVGSLSQELTVPGAEFSISRMFFGPPVSEADAIRAAYYNVLDIGNVDSVLQIKAKTSSSGFSFFGIFGWGSATAEIEGIGAHISKQIGAANFAPIKDTK